MTDPATRDKAFLDRPLARFLAALVILLVVASLLAIHWKDLFPETAGEGAAADDPVALCLAERAADIDKMEADGVIDDRQAALFKQRAEALCQAEFGESGPPPLPGQ
jgi:hypothetical protein